jgi:hypothetical protein
MYSRETKRKGRRLGNGRALDFNIARARPTYSVEAVEMIAASFLELGGAQIEF